MKKEKEQFLTGNIILTFVLIVWMILTSFSLRAQATVLTESEVRDAVETWVRYITADSRPDVNIEIMEPHIVGERTVAYIAHLSGEMNLEEATEKIKINTRRFAKRQMTWFRRFPQVHWLDATADSDPDSLAELARRAFE